MMNNQEELNQIVKSIDDGFPENTIWKREIRDKKEQVYGFRCEL